MTQCQTTRGPGDWAVLPTFLPPTWVYRGRRGGLPIQFDNGTIWQQKIAPQSVIRKSENLFCIATNAERVFAEIAL